MYESIICRNSTNKVFKSDTTKLKYILYIAVEGILCGSTRAFGDQLRERHKSGSGDV